MCAMVKTMSRLLQDNDVKRLSCASAHDCEIFVRSTYCQDFEPSFQQLALDMAAYSELGFATVRLVVKREPI